MKKYLEKLFVLLFVSVLLVPNFVFAEKDEEEEEVEKAPIQIYEFYSNSCGYCAALNEYLDSIEDEYGDYFDVVKFEVSSEDSAEMYDRVGKLFDADTSGVPFLVIGDKYISGFSEEDKAKIIDYIKAEYEKEEYLRYNLFQELDNYDDTAEARQKRNNIILACVSVVLVVGTVFVVIKARKED